MPETIPIGRLAGLDLSARPSSIIGSLLLWALFTILGWFLWVDLGAALIFGLICTLVHWLSDLVHHLGHAWAASRAGHPMTGICAWFIFGQSLYPLDEPPLPSRVHIRRALGGPIASIMLGCLAGLLALLIQSGGSLIEWILIILMLDNLIMLGFGAFLPLGFTDGSTLLAWWGKP